MKKSNTVTQDNGYASVRREILRLFDLAQRERIPLERYRYAGRALSLAAAYRAWRSGRPWDTELDSLLIAGVRACGKTDACMAEASLIWAETQAFHHRQMQIQHDELEAR